MEQTSLPRSFQDRLRQRKVIPFVGAGLSMSVQSNEGGSLFPNWKQLLFSAAERLTAENKPDDARLVHALVSKEDLYEAARRAKEGLGTAHWYEFLKSTFDRTFEEAQSDSLLTNRLVWTLGSNLVITTNYDRSLQWACPERADFRVWDIEAKVEQIAAIRDGTVQRPTVWHLHGQIDNAANMVLTPDGYSKLYGEGPLKKEIYEASLDSLRSVLKSQSLLFIGFSLRDRIFLAELLRLENAYSGAASQHYILLPRSDCNRADLRLVGVEEIAYDDHSHLIEILSAMAVEAQQSPSSYVHAQKYLVDRREGIHLFGGRGDAFFQLYDQAITGLRRELDIFSLKLSRFRQRHSKDLLQMASRVRVRIAILDPAFPLPNDFSIASIRDKEERSQNGSIMRDVAEWCAVYERYEDLRIKGQIEVAAGCGLNIHLYSTLPTINLFRADTNLFVGPYLLDVDDRYTPTFLINGDTQERSMGRNLYKAYDAHFNSIWDSATTRCVSAVAPEERLAWSRGEYAKVRQ